MCSQCFTEIPIYITKGENIDTEDSRNNAAAQIDTSSFDNKLAEFNGREPNTYPSDLEERIDHYLISYNRPTCLQIRSMPLNADGRTRGDTSKKMLENILKSIGYSSMYKHSEWICYKYWDWIRHDTSHINDKLKADFILSQPIVDANKGNRSSNINRDYRLYRHLEKLGYDKLDLSDFRMVKNDSLTYHENIWFNHVVPELGWDKSPYNYTPKRLWIFIFISFIFNI